MGLQNLTSRAIIGEFYARLEALGNASWVNGVSMYFESDQPSEEYKWLGMAPAMREWVGRRHIKSLRDQGITIENLEFEASLEVPTRWLRMDKTGQIQVRIDDLARRASTHWQSLLSSLVTNGESAVCYDGQYFFDTDHAEGASGTKSNDLTTDISAMPANLHGTTTAPSPEEVRAMVMNSVQAMLGFKDDQGEPMNEDARSFLVMVPTPYFTAAAAALSNPVLGGGDTNVITNLDGYNFSLAVNPRLTWTNKLAVFRTDGATAPFIRQEAGGVMVDALAEGSEEEFKHKRHVYGISADRAVGYGYWQQAVLMQAV